jgi:hypothetical protein
MTKFITIAGKKQVGKDTIADMMRCLLTWNPDSLQYKVDGGSVQLCSARGAIEAGAAMVHDHVHIVHFADVLKQVCSLLFDIDPILMETEGGKQSLTNVRWPHLEDQPGFTDVWVPNPDGKRMTVREVLQFVGTELFRNQLDADIWLKSVFNKRYGDSHVVIVADCRFPNEALAGKENGTLIRVNRNNGLKSDGHASEMSLDTADIDYDYVVDNDGSPAELLGKARHILTVEGLL